MKLIFSLITIFFLINSCRSENFGIELGLGGASCQFTSPSNILYTLSSVGTLNFTDSTLKRDYSLNLCTPLSATQNCNLKKDAYICQKTSAAGVALALTATTPIINNVNNNSTLLELSYVGETCGLGVNTIKTIVDIQCGKTNEILSVTPASTGSNCANKYNIVIQTPLVCPESTTPKKEGLSGGDIFLIIFFSVIGAYFIFGIIIQCYRGKRGSEAVPNIEFWSAFGALIKDGVFFIKGKITGKASTPGYEQI